MKPRRANLKPGRANLMLNGGGTDGRTDRRTYVSKFPPVFYRTSALWGRCPKAKSRPERANLKPRRANLKPRRVNLMLNGGGDGWKDGWTDRRMDRRTDGWTDGWTDKTLF